LDQLAVRKAIALAVDYDSVIANAMTNQSPTFAQSPRSLMNPTEGEQAMYDHDAVKDLQWIGNDIEGAKKLLDDAGIVDGDGDGWREYNGTNLKYNAVCPNGWTDWQASMALVAEAGQNIGINIETYFPEWDVYQTVFTDGTQTEYDIFMYAGDGTGPTYPWARVRQRLSSEFVGIQNNWSGNFGGYASERADEIIKLIPATTDPAELKALYTEAAQICLTDVPSFALMYRPELFHAVNEWPEAEILSTVTASIDSLGCLSKYLISRPAVANLSFHGGFRKSAQAWGCRVFAIHCPAFCQGEIRILGVQP
jgi:peptide/nickel transport system substrate-binding protein